MKRWVAISIIIGILGLCFIGAVTIRDVKHMSWIDYTPAEINRLAGGVEAFREEKGFYPERLTDLQTVSELHDREHVMELLAGRTGNKYHYQVLSNGFVIVVTKPSTLLSKSEMMEKRFAVDANLGGKVKVRTVLKPTSTNGEPHNR